VVLEVGSGNGFYSTYIAASLGTEGKLIAVDVQPQMLQMLKRRLQRRGLDSVLTTRLSGSNALGLDDLTGAVDLVVVINVMHELPDPRTALVELSKVLRDNGQLLLVEPRGHVSLQRFQTELDDAREAGLLPLETPQGLSVVLTKRSAHNVNRDG
jgi:ubiquinone/menaquinone biosynthesis C-methylase UbiE